MREEASSLTGPAADADERLRAVRDGGGKYLVVGGKSVYFYGEPPKRIAIMAFDNLEKAEAAFNSAAYKQAKAVGDKYATFRIYAVEGVTP